MKSGKSGEDDAVRVRAFANGFDESRRQHFIVVPSFLARPFRKVRGLHLHHLEAPRFGKFGNENRLQNLLSGNSRAALVRGSHRQHRHSTERWRKVRLPEKHVRRLEIRAEDRIGNQFGFGAAAEEYYPAEYENHRKETMPVRRIAAKSKSPPKTMNPARCSSCNHLFKEKGYRRQTRKL